MRLIKTARSALSSTMKLFSLIAATMFLSTSAQAAGNTVEYSCNEGIPLIVEFINTNSSSIAVISHDSSPRIALDNVRSGSGARYTDGNWVLHVKGDTALVGTQGQTDDVCHKVGAQQHHQQNNHQQHNNQNHGQHISFPRQAKSWGGIVRSGPGQHYRKVGSLREGEWVIILERTNEIFQDRPWFKIKYRGGRIGYKWGGILCSVGEFVEGTFQTCN